MKAQNLNELPLHLVIAANAGLQSGEATTIAPWARAFAGATMTVANTRFILRQRL